MRLIINEGRIEDLKSKNPLLSSEIDELASSDPSGNLKYLDWEVKQLKNGFSVNDIVPTIEAFHSGGSFKHKDINAYKTLKELEDEVKVGLGASKRQKKGLTKTHGAEKIFEDEGYALYFIKTKEACQIYGAGTKWCITMKDKTYFERYTMSNVVFYYAISKVHDPEDPEAKVAIAVARDVNNKVKGVELFDAEDEGIPDYADDEYLADLVRIAEADAANRPKIGFARLTTDDVSVDDVMEHLRAAPSWQTKLMILKNLTPNVMKDVKPLLMKEDDYRYRHMLAAALPPEELSELAHDDSDIVRAMAAKRLPLDELSIMYDDDSPLVMARLIDRVPRGELYRYVNADDDYVRVYVAKHAPLDVVKKMADDLSQNIRVIVKDRLNKGE